MLAGSPCNEKDDDGNPIFDDSAKFCFKGLVCEECPGEDYKVCRSGQCHKQGLIGSLEIKRAMFLGHSFVGVWDVAESTLRS